MEDALLQEHSLAILGISLESEPPGEGDQTGIEQLAQFRQHADITALQVAAIDEGRIACLTGGSDGCLRRLQLLVPQLPNAEAADIQLLGQDSEQGTLLPWHKLHSSSITSLDIHPSTAEVVTAGLDGALHVTAMSCATSSFSTAQAHVQGRATVSYRAVHWSTPDTFVAAGSTGGIEVWDKRIRGLQPATRSPLQHGLTGNARLDQQQGMRGQIHCLDVHPAQPFTCATGASQGCVALWDLRFAAAPSAACLTSEDAGDVLEVHFDPCAAQQHCVLFCTDAGCLARFSEADRAPGHQWGTWDPTSHGNSQDSRPHMPHTEPVYEDQYAIIPSFDVHARSSITQDIFCVTDHECLVHAEVQPLAAV